MTYKQMYLELVFQAKKNNPLNEFIQSIEPYVNIEELMVSQAFESVSDYEIILQQRLEKFSYIEWFHQAPHFICMNMAIDFKNYIELAKKV